MARSPLGQKLLARWLRPMRERSWLQPSYPVLPGLAPLGIAVPLLALLLSVAGWFASSRRGLREVGRNVEVMWLTCRLVAHHKTIADFRKDNGAAIKRVCAQFIELCRQTGLLTTSSSAIDGSNYKFKAVNTRDKNFTRNKVKRHRAQLEQSVARYLAQLDTADRQEPSEELPAKTQHLKEKLVKLESQMQRLAAMEKLMLASPDQQISLTDSDSRSMATSGRGSGVVGYNVQVAVDTQHHLIIAHEVTNSGFGHNLPISPAGQSKSSASMNSKPLPIAAITAAWKSLPVTKPELR
jgi:hypothetical protein